MLFLPDKIRDTLLDRLRKKLLMDEHDKLNNIHKVPVLSILACSFVASEKIKVN